MKRMKRMFAEQITEFLKKSVQIRFSRVIRVPIECLWDAKLNFQTATQLDFIHFRELLLYKPLIYNVNFFNLIVRIRCLKSQTRKNQRIALHTWPFLKNG